MAECMEGGGSYGLFHHQLLHEWPQSRHQTYVIPHGHVCQQLNVEALSDHRGKRDKRPCLVREPIKAGENGFTDTTRHMQFRHGTATKTPTCSVLKDIAAGDQRLEELFYEKGIPFSTLVESRDEVGSGATHDYWHQTNANLPSQRGQGWWTAHSRNDRSAGMHPADCEWTGRRCPALWRSWYWQIAAGGRAATVCRSS